jgi:pilus assembly protein FimV
MALGFGFNKVKVLAQAEKFVQQGKLSNAIAEYEKIIKEDPKDLTVLNTVGDLYARMGNNDQAVSYFKRVGDQYAQNGFTVKAIAIYKKLTKIAPFNAENTTRLAELYGQQGLFNDARVQYMQVADQLLKAGDNNQAARVFQKILELDPENAHTQTKLADLYTKLGKKDEARNIYYSAAESLYARGSYAAAEEALGRVLTLDPKNPGALLLRGLISVEAGDSNAAVIYLEQVQDLDSRPDGLRALLRAKLQTGNPEGVEAVASRLLMAHNDVTGITTLAQWFATNGYLENALQLYEAHTDRLFAGNQAALQETIYPLMTRARDNPGALAILNRLLNQAGDHSQTAEMIELQAHAAAKKGNFAEARDLYKKLTEMEPENALHSQNYKQMLGKLGEDSATRILTPEEAAQAFMVEELDETATPVHQAYDPPTERAIESALTDAELYVSYNVPSKAIPPLEAALPLAPQDVNLNQRLASLYVRAERYADAARMYQNLSEIYKELGHPTESVKYLEASKRYALRAPKSAGAAAAPAAAEPAKAAKAAWPPEPAPEPVAAPQVEVRTQEFKTAAASEPVQTEEMSAEPSVQEFTFDTPEVLAAEPEPAVAVPAEPVAPEPVVSEIILEPVQVEETPAAAPAHEIDISNEWEEMIEVEPAPELHVQPAHDAAQDAGRTSEIELEAASTIPEADTTAQVTDKVQEIRFYLTQEMWEQAKSAILELTELAPDAPEVTELIAAVSAGQSKSASTAQSEAPPAFADEPVVEIEEPAPPPTPQPAPAPVVVAPPKAPEPSPAKALEPPLPVRTERHRPIAEPLAAMEPEDVLDEDLLGEDVLDIAEPPKAKPAAPPPPPPVARAKEKSTEDILGDFILDLEESELADFAPRQQSAPAAASAAAAPAMDLHSNDLRNKDPRSNDLRSNDPRSNDLRNNNLRSNDRRSNGDIQDTETANALSDILSELREETAEAAEPEEDPETHYNLGIAFKEMGLLDEAIGELQKVCHAVDRGAGFSQPIQALTWLAQCLVDKGAPEAAVRWYQKALQLPGLDDGSRCAIYYDLAMAYEASGDKKSALANFMEVYGSNIDFRDVASRIKALKS